MRQFMDQGRGQDRLLRVENEPDRIVLHGCEGVGALQVRAAVDSVQVSRQTDGDRITESLTDRVEKAGRIDAECTVDDLQRGLDPIRCCEGGGGIVAVGESGVAAAQDPDSVAGPDLGGTRPDSGQSPVCCAAGAGLFLR